MMEGWKNTDIGFVPSDWDVDRIDKFFSIQQGKQVSKKNRIGKNQKPFLRTSNLLWGKVILEKLDYLHFSTEEEKKFKLEYNDLLVCEGGDIGRTAIWKNEMEGIYYQNHLHRVRTKVDDIEPEFILNWMQYAFLYGKVYFGRANITTIPNLSKSRLSEFAVPKPPLPEQRKIAYVLTTLQKAIDQQDKLIKTTTELKKALMQKLFTEGLNGEKQKETEIGLVPESWEVVELGKYAFIENGYAFKSKDYVNTGMPLIRISNVSHGFLIDKDNKYLPEEYLKEHSKYALHNGDLIMSLTRPVTSGGLKYCFITDKHIPALLNQRVGRFQVRNKEKLSKDFLYHLVFTQYFVGELFRLFGGSSQQPNVSPTQLENFKVPIPTKNEQDLIAKYLFQINSKIQISENKKHTLTELFNTMLHELMTGQRRVNEIDFENEKEELRVATVAKPKRKANPYFKRTVLAAYIVDNSLDDPHFNRIKFQKLLYVAQFAGELDIVSNYHRDAAGPYDNQMMRSIYSQFTRLKWFGTKTEGKEIKYFPLENSSGYLQYFYNHWGMQQQTINQLLQLFRPFNYERCEIVATLFECWKNMIANKQQINDKTLAKAYNEFHPEKKQQPNERIIKALNWMKKEGIIPKNS